MIMLSPISDFEKFFKVLALIFWKCLYKTGYDQVFTEKSWLPQSG